MWEIGPNRGLRRKWPIPNRYDKGKGNDDDLKYCYVNDNIIS